MTVLAVLAVLESTLPSCCLSYKIQHSEATVAVLTLLALSAAVAVSVMTATPLKPNPLSRPISRDTAILSLRYPISRDTFQGRLALPQYDALPPLST